MKDTYRAGPFQLGMDNKQADYALPRDEQGHEIAARNLVNVDVDSQGNVRRRDGFVKVLSACRPRCGFACEAGTFFVSGGNLMRLHEDDSATALTGGVVGEHIAYEHFNGVVYVSDGLSTWRIVNGSVLPWSVDAHLEGDPEYMPMPPCRIIKQHHGRLYGAADNVVWYTEPYAYGSVRKASNFIQFTGDVTVMEPVDGGIWVVADKTYFLRGAGPGFSVETPLEYGAVFGTSARTSGGEAVWYSDKGMVIGGKDGQARNVQEANIAADLGERGAALMREENGVRHYVATVVNPIRSRLSAEGFFDAEVIRKGA